MGKICLVSAAFPMALPNMEHCKIRNTFPTLHVQQTCCPKVDSIFKSSSVKSKAKSLDSELARLQAFVLDPVTLLVNTIHRLDDENYTIEEAHSDAMDTLRLLGNASYQISRTQRKKVLKVLNPSIQELAVEDDLFKSAAMYLFGDGFEQKMKD